LSGWAGLLLGVSVALAVIPLVVSILDGADDAWILLAALVVLVASAAFGQVLGLQLGERLRGNISGRVGSADRVAGAVAGSVGVLVVFWLLVPTLAEVPGWISAQVRGSFVAEVIEERLPEPPDALSALRDAVGERSFPTVFDEAPDLADPGPAPTQVPLDQRTQALVAESVVRLHVPACGRIQQGTGFVAADRIVITNAHVVAGASEVTVIDDVGVRHAGVVVGFDPERDLAAVRVDDLDRRPLVTAPVEPDTLAAAFGHPGGGELRIAPVRIADVLKAKGRDLYDEVETLREVVVMAVNLRLGDSGAPVVDQRGAVVGVAFAVAPDGDETAYGVTVAELDAFIAAQAPGGQWQPSAASDCL
ncbi:MAG: trypsin-like peptidase domain-containing protein, partial [Acidimicrobiales bacterium]|nr:trypsin-like peptidase domain-containing protein [Acidimicrobiales bacterium]